MSQDSKRVKKAVFRTFTCSAPVNMAVIKYWGKRDEELILPINSSISATIDQNQMKTVTTVSLSEDYDKDSIYLNGREEDISLDRLQNCLREIRARAASRNAQDPALAMCVRIVSVNNFPTAAGLASSAAGYACLVYALAHLFHVQDTELTSIARQGSGSACRSLHGGFVQWHMGQRADGEDSIATQVVDENHWPEMQLLILVVNAKKKATSSTAGMQTSVQTSELLKHRAAHIVPERVARMEHAIKTRDFETFGKITIQESNQFHAVCLDTYPPIFYLNDVSKAVIHVLTRVNSWAGEIKAAYTYDAGPNTAIYCRSADVPLLLAVIAHYFPSPNPQYIQGRTSGLPSFSLPEGLLAAINLPSLDSSISYIIHTGVGAGPQVLPEADSLIDAEGEPKNVSL